MSLEVANIKLSFTPTNPANIADKKGVLSFDATVTTDSTTGNSKLSVIHNGEEIELYEIRGYSKQTEKFDGKVRPINNPENTIFDILKSKGKLKSRNYKNDLEAKEFIATGMYIPSSRSGTQQFSDTSQQLFQEGSTSSERSTLAASSAEGEAFAGTQQTDSPLTLEPRSTNNEPGTEIPESQPIPGVDGPSAEAQQDLVDQQSPANVANPGTAIDPSVSDFNDINSAFRDDAQSGGPTPGTGGAGLVYPLELQDLGQDYMKIISFRYVPEELKTNIRGTPTLSRNFSSANGDGPPIYLPIQGLVDNNTVSWGENQLNTFQAFFYKQAYNMIGGENNALNNAIDDAKEILLKRGDVLSQALRMELGGRAVGASGLLSRAGGAIVNPNLTLLFNNPELRKFNFTFRFFPREDAEATVVRKIIRTFKQTMAVRKEASKFFLLAPNLYKISFHTGGSSPASEHKALGRSKVCALLGCSVNYLPDGSYMTFDDSSRTMTSYEMTLSFNEVEPVYYNDYIEAGLAPDEIGF
jgi:hypothetical protein